MKSSELVFLCFMHRYGLQRPRHRGERMVQRREREPRIAYQRHIHGIINAQHRGIYVQMNYLHLARRRMAPALGGYRAGAAADENDQIRLIDDGARVWRTGVGADDADGEGILIPDGALAADGASDR